MSAPVIKNLPLHDEVSGIANLDARIRQQNRQLHMINVSLAFAFGMVFGAMIVWLLVITFTK